MEAFCYEDLDLNRPTFRLVRLLKGVADDPRCEIFQASFDHREHTISYEALSYTWGSMHWTERIWMDGKELHVTSNLRKALRYPQLKERDPILWVDALCINSDRTPMKHLKNWSFRPQLSEGFDSVSNPLTDLQ
jgi:hypothetical protein